MQKEIVKLWSIVIVLALLLAACNGGAAPAAPPAAEEPAAEAPAAEEPAAEEPAAEALPGLRTPQEAALEAAGGEQLGGTVSVLGTWGGSEQESFLAMVRPFEEATGTTIEYEGTRDLNAVLTTRVQGGNPPDLAGLPGPGQMAEFAADGHLVDLSDVLDLATMQEDYAQSWIDLASHDGRPVGIFIKAALKGLIWYNPNQYTGPLPPESWDELQSWAAETAAAGTTPWCIGLESGAASGWPGTDWIEDIVLRQSGPDVYDQWYQGELPWTSPEIRSAFEAFGAIVTDPQMVFGGPLTALTLNFGNGGDALFTDPPGCYLHHQASFITDFFVTNFPDLQPVEDFNFFAFPDIDPQYSGAVEAAGDLFGMFNDTPQARALLNYLTTPEAQAIWVQRGGALSPNRRVPEEAYPDPLAQQAGQILTSADIVRFDASDLMPEAMNNAFWSAILEYVQNPGDLDRILENLDQVQQDAYQ
ncbi:MAG: ABC transporter substrate-binding protein [Chloroflexi bacterium]|nr:MAG: ABC transporter substrate-binding protein [Chloroflexota bacterium]